MQEAQRLFRSYARQMPAQEVTEMQRIKHIHMPFMSLPGKSTRPLTGRPVCASLLTALLLSVFVITGINVSAASPTDEILNYTITVDVNEDATLRMNYHLDWKVLDDSIGAVDWVDIGIPNMYTVSQSKGGDNIKNMTVTSNSPGDHVMRIFFNRSYYEDEIIPIDFEIIQDYMYEMNVLKDGETVYYLIPGWFKDIAVDSLTVSWNADKATAWSHGASPENGRLIWTGSLAAGQKFNEISVTYPTTAYSFHETDTNSYKNDYQNSYSQNYSYSYDYDYDYDSCVSTGLSAILSPIGFFIVISFIVKKIKRFTNGAGFSSSEPATTKKITRTLIKYYPECPGCAAPRPENAEKCEYCGRSFIESEEVVEEKEINDPEKYSSEGTYRYGSSPNTFVRVHVVHVPAPRPPKSSCAHSSCAHSSCACAHSCACACACACAGGGRAGCSTKDFYNTNLKLKQLETKRKKQNNGII